MTSTADKTTVIVAGARTPFGRLLGSLKDFSGVDLGAVAIKGALERAGVPASEVEYVIMGQVLTAGAGQMPARQAAIKAGIGWDVPTLTINKMCLSGIDAIALADQLIRAGEFDVVVAGGQESMTQAPHLLPNSRGGFKYGNTELVDHMAFDGLFDAFTDQPMGALTEQGNDADGFTREQQDEFAARSHRLAAAAWKNGVFDDEVVPVSIPQRKGDPIEFAEDEGIRANTTVESLSGLRPAFRKDGTITAGNSSQISDGAAAVLWMDEDKAKALGLKPRAKLLHQLVTGSDPYYLLDGPVDATYKMLDRSGLAMSDFDVFEINEAFAAVVLSWAQVHKPDLDRVNINGGAIALGHPVGATGARLALTLLHEMRLFKAPEEIAAVVAFLASEEAGYITGANISVNGGMHMM